LGNINTALRWYLVETATAGVTYNTHYGQTVTGLTYAYNPTTGQLKHFASIDEAKAAAYQMKEANDRKEAADRRKFNLMNSMQ
jgi:hypothetical protein